MRCETKIKLPFPLQELKLSQHGAFSEPVSLWYLVVSCFPSLFYKPEHFGYMPFTVQKLDLLLLFIGREAK